MDEEEFDNTYKPISSEVEVYDTIEEVEPCKEIKYIVVDFVLYSRRWEND